MGRLYGRMISTRMLQSHTDQLLLGGKKVNRQRHCEDMLTVDDPWVKSYFSGQACASDRSVGANETAARQPLADWIRYGN